MHLVQQKLLKLADTCNLAILPLRDIAKIINEDHPQTIKHHLEALEKKGLIEWDRTNKTIKKCTTGASVNTDFAVIPVVGAANCGLATLYADEIIVEHVKVSFNLLRNRRNTFAVRAIGCSMNRANINGKTIEEGDLVIIDPTDKNIESNDYVLSIIDEMANIKRIVIDQEHEQITLMSESTQHYPPIYLSACEITRYVVSGKVIQVIKR
jgi:SOS-response transcriptional repressor LexA